MMSIRQVRHLLILTFLSASIYVHANDSLTIEEHIRPILRAYCFDCHGAVETKEGGLDLRLVRFQLQGGESGPAIVPGDVEASYLIQRIRDGRR